MRKNPSVSAFVRKDLPACCKAAVLRFAEGDRYQGAGEPGDRIRCGCGNRIVYAPSRSGKLIGWKVDEERPQR